jgi:hypothetical protein
VYEDPSLPCRYFYDCYEWRTRPPRPRRARCRAGSWPPRPPRFGNSFFTTPMVFLSLYGPFTLNNSPYTARRGDSTSHSDKDGCVLLFYFWRRSVREVLVPACKDKPDVPEHSCYGTFFPLARGGTMNTSFDDWRLHIEHTGKSIPHHTHISFHSAASSSAAVLHARAARCSRTFLPSAPWKCVVLYRSIYVASLARFVVSRHLEPLYPTTT